ncbi:sodium/hydrogen exchanger [Streptomyces narbonensis]
MVSVLVFPLLALKLRARAGEGGEGRPAEAVRGSETW